MPLTVSDVSFDQVQQLHYLPKLTNFCLELYPLVTTRRELDSLMLGLHPHRLGRLGLFCPALPEFGLLMAPMKAEAVFLSSQMDWDVRAAEALEGHTPKPSMNQA